MKPTFAYRRPIGNRPTPCFLIHWTTAHAPWEQGYKLCVAFGYQEIMCTTATTILFRCWIFHTISWKPPMPCLTMGSNLGADSKELHPAHTLSPFNVPFEY